MIYHALGLMSGSSLDGLDIAYTRIEWREERVARWELLAAQTLPFSEQWVARLMHLPQQDALTFAKTHVYFGRYMAELVQQFRQEHNITQLDFIASHGHTIFHQPDKRFTVQIGDGATLAALTQARVISDFRSHDVALDGEGAPLAPLVDKYLFEGYDFYLNIGGIANISTQITGKWLGFDICPANQLLNFLAQQLGANYDNNGDWARQGRVDDSLFSRLSNFDFYKQRPPKSLGNEWIRQQVLPLLLQAEISLYDALATVSTHIATEIARTVEKLLANTRQPKEKHRLLATGGGAFNVFLMEQLQALTQKNNTEIIVPEPNIVQFKEALLMALLGVLRMENVPNSYRSITGALRDTVNGGIYC